MGVSNPGAIPGMVGAGGTPLGDPYGYKELRRTPSTSAIYETLRRSKELRESLTSRPSSRLSIDNNMPTGTRDHSAVRIIFNNSLPKLSTKVNLKRCYLCFFLFFRILSISQTLNTSLFLVV